MTYRKGNAILSVEQIDGFGKNPGLWVGTDTSMIKLASFGSEEKADLFCEWLDYFFFNSSSESEMKLLQ